MPDSMTAARIHTHSTTPISAAKKSARTWSFSIAAAKTPPGPECSRSPMRTVKSSRAAKSKSPSRRAHAPWSPSASRCRKRPSAAPCALQPRSRTETVKNSTPHPNSKFSRSPESRSPDSTQNFMCSAWTRMLLPHSANSARTRRRWKIWTIFRKQESLSSDATRSASSVSFRI